MQNTAWIFPGQGSQSVGMAWDLCEEFPRTCEILEEASDLSGFPLKDLCLHGPEEMLTRTDVLQPALAAVSLACVDLLREHGHEPDAVAGHSLGEFAALYAAGVLTRTETLRLVVRRGQLMHRASLERPGGMVAVKDLTGAEVRDIGAAATRGHSIGVANYNAPGETVLSGEAAGLERAALLVAERGGRCVTLRVSGAWHSPLMGGIVDEFHWLVRQAHFSAPRVPLFMNVTGTRQADPEQIRGLVVRQVTSPVLWVDTIRRIAGGGVTEWLEVGPGKVLRGLLRRTLAESAYVAHGIATPRNVRRFRASGLKLVSA